MRPRALRCIALFVVAPLLLPYSGQLAACGAFYWCSFLLAEATVVAEKELFHHKSIDCSRIGGDFPRIDRVLP